MLRKLIKLCWRILRKEYKKIKIVSYHQTKGEIGPLITVSYPQTVTDKQIITLCQMWTLVTQTFSGFEANCAKMTMVKKEDLSWTWEFQPFNL